MKTLTCLLLLITVSLGQERFLDSINYARIVCLNDSTGRQVQIAGKDTSVVLKDVVKIVLMNSALYVRFKDKHEVIFPNPPFKRAIVD